MDKKDLSLIIFFYLKKDVDIVSQPEITKDTKTQKLLQLNTYELRSLVIVYNIIVLFVPSTVR